MNNLTDAPATDAGKRDFLRLRAYRHKSTSYPVAACNYHLSFVALCSRVRQLVARFLGVYAVAVCVASCGAGSVPSNRQTVAHRVPTAGTNSADSQESTATGQTRSEPATGPKGSGSADVSGDSSNTSGATTTCADLGEWATNDAEFEDEVIRLVNEVRQKGTMCGGVTYPPMPPLATNAAIRCVARRYAKNMSDNDFFEHEGKDKSTPASRISDSGLAWSGLAENIAMGQSDPGQVMQAWLASPGHCENLMGDYTTLGVGFYKNYWVQDFLQDRNASSKN